MVQLIKQEPVMFQAVVQAAFALLLAFGLKLSPGQVGATLAFVAAVLSFWTRTQVSIDVKEAALERVEPLDHRIVTSRRSTAALLGIGVVIVVGYLSLKSGRMLQLHVSSSHDFVSAFLQSVLADNFLSVIALLAAGRETLNLLPSIRDLYVGRGNPRLWSPMVAFSIAFFAIGLADVKGGGLEQTKSPSVDSGPMHRI